ncbi:MAG: sigma factor-like helix-turn-helix DNA-binding protein [Pseudomonadota bacterium]
MKTASLDLLIERAGAGSRAAMGALYDATAPAMYAMALAILKDKSAAETALIDAYGQIWKAAPTYVKSDSPAATWIAMAVREVVLAHARRDGGRAALEPAIAPGEVNKTSNAQSIYRAGEEERLAAALSALDDASRASIRRAFFEGAPYGVLAQHLSSPLGGVKSRIRRGLLVMRDRMEGTGAADTEKQAAQ